MKIHTPRSFLCSLGILFSISVLLSSIEVFAQSARPLSAQTNDAIVYHGKLVKPDGRVVEGSVRVTIKIFSPEPEVCLLWKETQTVTTLKGAFSLEMGHSANRAPSGAGSASDGAPSFRDVFLNASTVSYNSSECASGFTAYTPSPSDDRLMTASFDVAGTIVSTENIPIKSVPFAKQASEIGGFGPSNLMKISGAGSSIQFTPDEVQDLKNLLGGSINWDLGSSRLTNVAAPVDAGDATNKQWVVDYVAANGGGTLTQSQVVTALGYTPVSSTSPSEVSSALGYTPVNRSGDTMTGSLSLPSNGLSVGSSQLVVSGGNVGIGTTSPAHKLHVSDSDTSTQLRVVNTNSTAARYPGVTVSNFSGSTAGGPNIYLMNSRGSEVSPSAVGLGDTLGSINFYGQRSSTSNDLNRGASIRAIPRATFSASEAQTDLAFFTANPGATSDTEKMRISSSGYVGIGTSSPTEKLDVSGKVKGTELCIGGDCRSSWPLSGGGGAVQSVNVGGLPLSVVNSSTTPSISIAQASSSAAGFLSSADWNTFNSKQATLGFTPISNSLPSGQVLLGNGSNVASASWFGIGQMRNNIGAAQFPAACAASQTLTWSAVTDVLSCTNITIGDSSITYANKAQNTVLAGPAIGGSGAPTFRALEESDIPNLNWSKITGEPTTLAGFGITNAVANGGQAGAVVVGSSDSNSLSLNTSGSPRLTVMNSGNVGIGTTTPAVKLEVAGDLKVGDSAATCTATTEGSLRYNSTTKVMQFCNGTVWGDISSGSGGGGVTPPVGAIIAWHKSLTNTPALPTGWVECNGQVLSDAGSVYNGQTIPNLNGQVYAGGKGYYLRGGATSGAFNPSTAWDDNGNNYSFSNTSSAYYGGAYGQYADTENGTRANYNASVLNPNNFRFQVAAMTVVLIIRVK